MPQFKNVVFLFSSILCFIGLTEASFGQQQIKFGSSPNPVGSGARALGMGGAFIAVADDATAASWNPAGLTQLELPEISVVGAYVFRNEDNAFSLHPESSLSHDTASTSLNYLSASYPFVSLNRNMIVSVNYQHLYDLKREWDFSYQMPMVPGFMVDSTIRHGQEGGLAALGLAYGVQITPAWSFGATVNIWDKMLDQNEWKEDTLITGPVVASGVATGIDYMYRNNKRYSLDGINFNIGALWRPTENLTLGAVVKTPFTADIELEEREFEEFTSSSPRVGGKKNDEELDMPLSYGIGAAYRFSDAFSMALDIYRTRWDNFLYRDAAGVEKSFVSGVSDDASDIDPTTQIRLGCEYLFIMPEHVIPLRWGIFYDPAPAEKSPDDFFGVTVGSGVAAGRYLFDVAYQLRFGDDVNSHLVRGHDGDFSQDVLEHTVYSSLIIHF